MDYKPEKNCQHCGGNVGWKPSGFCGHCGEDLKQKAEERPMPTPEDIKALAEKAGKKCPHCGQPMVDGFDFCPSCHMKLKSPNPPPENHFFGELDN